MKRPDVPLGRQRRRPDTATRFQPSVGPFGQRPARENSDTRRFTAFRRRRRQFVILGLGGFLSLVLIVTGVVLSPLLTLTEIEVKGRETIAQKVIVGAVSDQVGKPLALIDYESIASRLQSVTRIESFTTEIRPPHTLVIRIVERDALGFIATKTKWSIVDAAGVVIDTVSSRPNRIPHIDVPATTDPAFSAVVDTLTALPGRLRKKVSAIAATSRDTVSLTLRGSGHRIVWGSPDNSSLKVLVMERALDVANRSGGVFEINVSAPDNIILQPLG